MPFGLRRARASQIALLSAGLAIIVLIAVLSIFLLGASRRENAWVQHTLQAENQISQVLLEIRRAESTARAFALTRDGTYRRDYETAASAIMPAIERLKTQVADNASQLEAVGRLKSTAGQRLAQMAELVARIDRNEPPQDIAGNAGAGPDSMVSLRAISDQMIREERRLLDERTQTAERTRLLTSITMLTGSACLIVFGVISILLVRRSLRERDFAEARLRETNLNLETLVEERTVDLREANEEIQRFAYIVSHDLRSPLVNIMGFTSELDELRRDIFARLALQHDTATSADPEEAASELAPEDRRLADEFGEALDFIKTSIGKMDRLIGAILGLTREGRRQFNPEPIALRKLIESICATMAHQAQEADATVEIGELPDVVSDRLALEQIFGNLIDNALKYLKSGVPGHVRVTGRKKLGFAVIEVADDGRGIDARDHQRIFDLFRRAGPQDRPGQGIGLAHVRALVRRMGGSMSVQSEPGRGSTFTVTLPLDLSLRKGFTA